ncbi:LysR substrate-binding domain-containing protein [Algirhabdus cladophorae]|uniref:LysR substrate-binding domain-containing protein n=1 Tax=Algirhabdus cladophorae TaxID=3377108 RepID=UPI003B84A6BA
MFENLPSLKSIHAFEAAARLGSFSVAGVELSLTPGAIGYQVKQLEKELGVPLFERRPRKIILTEAGQALYRTTHKLLRDLDSEIKHIAPDRGTGKVIVAASTYFVARWLTERLGRFIDSNPRIDLELTHDVNDPGFALRDVDYAIRWGNGDWKDYHAIPLLEVPLVAVCAPSQLNGKSRIRSSADLKKATLLCDDPHNDFWSEYLRKCGLDPEHTGKRRVISDANVRLKWTMDGLGFALSQPPLIQTELNEGKLVIPFNEKLEGYGYYLLSSSKKATKPVAETFKKWVLDEADAFKIEHMM